MSGPLVAPALPAAAGGKAWEGCFVCSRPDGRCLWLGALRGASGTEELGWGGCQLGNSSTAGLVPDSFSIFSGPMSILICEVPLAYHVVTEDWPVYRALVCRAVRPWGGPQRSL